MMSQKIARFALIATTIFAYSAHAATVTHMDTIPVVMTNWTDSLTFPQIDIAAEDFISVTVMLTGTVNGSAQAESLDAQPANVTLDLEAKITLQDPTGSDLVAVLPVVSRAESLSLFDGTIDFGGGSGFMTGMVMGDATDMVVLTNPADLAAFIGTGSVVLPVEAEGMSSGTGAGNLITQFATNAGADVKVTYEYVPEPSSAVLIVIGALGLLGTGRKSRLG